MKRVGIKKGACLLVAAAMIVFVVGRANPLLGAERPARLTFVYVQQESSPKTQWLIRIYTEALRRMGIEFQFVDLPGKRASLYSNSGKVDGELNRIATYGDVYTNMVRVPERNLEGVFAAYALNPELHLEGWDSLNGSPYMVGFLQGVAFCEKNLSRVLPKDQLCPVKNLELGLKMLSAGRIDVLVFNQAVALLYVTTGKGQASLDDGGGPRKIYEAGIMGYTHGHAWLHKSHADLVEPLAEVLREMKAEGLFEHYSRESGFYP